MSLTICLAIWIYYSFNIILLEEKMDDITLRKVQLIQLEIAKEVKRICEKNNIKFFLTAGTLLGAIRHKGFIPWDDDLDMAMLREDYDKFLQIAPKEIKPEYEIQTWDNDVNCPYEFAKIRKKNTLYKENKGNKHADKGIYIDLIVYSDAPSDEAQRIAVHNKMLDCHRLLLMKCKYRPWNEDYGVNYGKKIAYLFYLFRSVFYSHKRLVDKFNKLLHTADAPSEYLYGMVESKNFFAIERAWYDTIIYQQFEDTEFPIAGDYKHYLALSYGDYMSLPPENERENRHQITQVKF